MWYTRTSSEETEMKFETMEDLKVYLAALEALGRTGLY